MSPSRLKKFLLLFALSLFAVVPAFGDTFVNAFADIYQSGGANSLLGGLPNPLGASFAPGSVISMTFTVTGTMSAGPICPTTGPDGDPTAGFGTGSGAGPGSTLSGISYNAACVMPLLGVFLGPTLPAVTPATLDFSSAGIGYNFSSLAPVSGQIFFIGDGLTGTGTGSQQTFYVPADATGIYFGIIDNLWFDNSGGYSVHIDEQLPGTGNETPEPATLMLTTSGLLGLMRLRRK